MSITTIGITTNELREVRDRLGSSKRPGITKFIARLEFEIENREHRTHGTKQPRPESFDATAGYTNYVPAND